MNEKETAILEKLESGDYNGFCPPSRSYGSVNRGGAVDTGYIFDDGKIIEYKDITRKFFDGKENERTTERTTRVLESDWERLDVLAKLGYRMDDPDANEYSQAYYDERRRQKAEERAAMKAATAKREEVKRAEQKAAIEPCVKEHIPAPADGSGQIQEDDELSEFDKLFGIIGVGFLIVAGIKWAVPKVKTLWNEKISPRFETRKVQCLKCSKVIRYDAQRKCWFCKDCGKSYQIKTTEK